MQVGFQQSQQSFENVDRLETKGYKKVAGKYFRDSHDPLVARQEFNDESLPWNKYSAFLWDIDGRRQKFMEKESEEAALESGKYFDSPLKAKKAKERALLEEKIALEAEIKEGRKQVKKIKAEPAEVQAEG